MFPCGGSGLEIGDYCSISAGVQIYSHHTVEWALSLGEEEPEETPTKIGSGVLYWSSIYCSNGSDSWKSEKSTSSL